MNMFSKGPSRPSRTTEYKKKLAELDDFIAKNRLVSKEAQMSSMSGEGYTDPRFIKTTGNPLIDKWGMRPFPAEGSGQILSTTELGMGGKKELLNIENPGRYRASEDGLGSIVYKDISDIYEGTGLTPHTPEDTQKHEIFHRAADKSGWIRSFYNSPYLKKKAKSLSGERGRILTPLINEAVAHSYEYDADDYSKNKKLKEEIRFRASRFNLKNPEKIADEVFNNIEDLRDDFEKYIELVNVEYLPNNRISYTTTRTNKATGGEVNYLQSAIDMLSNPVPNIVKAPTKKDKKKSSAASLIELEIDPVFRVPTNVKTFVDSVLLNKKDNITNNNFSNSELKVVKDLIVESANNKNIYTESLENPFNPLKYIPGGKKLLSKRKEVFDEFKKGDFTTPGYVDYNTYNKKTGIGSIKSSIGFQSNFSDIGRVLTTLGQFKYNILPNGDVQVTDTYDFNPLFLDDQGQESKGANAFSNTELSLLSGGYYPLRKLGEKLLPEREGKGRKINIVLPKDLFSKEEYSSIKNLTNSRVKKAKGGEIQESLNELNNYTDAEREAIIKAKNEYEREAAYKKELADLDAYISDNRLVSKEAQMSSMSGEGYKDPRFTVSFDNPIINKFALHPFAGEGSGYQPNTKELGMEGPEELLESSVGGRYYPRTDVVMFKDPYRGITLDRLTELGIDAQKYKGHIKTKEDIQKHELLHRTAHKSGYLDFLPTSEFLKENSTTKYLKGSLAKFLTPLINEALAESYEDIDSGGLQKRIRFRASRFNGLKENKKQEIADEIFENIDVLKQDFENYLESQMNPDELNATQKNAGGGEIQSLINEIGIQPIEKEVRNDLRADGTKKSQIGWKGRIVSNVTGKIHTELTIDDKYPLINPYTTEEQIEHLKNNNYEGNAQKLQETEIGREMLLNARKHYEESLQKGVSPFVTDDELQRQKLGLEKKANGGEASYLQSAIDMLTEGEYSAPVTEAPPGTFDLGSIEPIDPMQLQSISLMGGYEPNLIDKFAMTIFDPTKKLKLITTPGKMLLKPLFAKKNKLKQLLKKQEQNYKRGQDLSSKADPKDIEQGNYMMNAAIKSGKRFQRQLNELEEKIRKIYQSK